MIETKILLVLIPTLKRNRIQFTSSSTFNLSVSMTQNHVSYSILKSLAQQSLLPLQLSIHLLTT